MTARLLVLGAGSGAANNLIRSLRAAERPPTIVGAHTDRFVLRNAETERRVLLPPLSHREFAATLARFVAAERIDVVIPTSDADVRAVASAAGALRGRTFLPALATIDVCQDKYAFFEVLATRGVPVPQTVALETLDDVDAAFVRLQRHARLWCRRRRGQGGLGALPVAHPMQARAWIEYWRDMRGVPVTEFTLAEYLPGRDFAGQALFAHGHAVLIRAYERLAYLGGGGAPSGVGLATLSRRAADTRLIEIVTAAVRALEPTASGIFTFDAREDVEGRPKLTEINAGRFSLSMNLLDLSAKVSMAEMYVRLALGEHVVPIVEPAPAEEWYMVRDYDGPPGVWRADDFFEGIEEAR